jgi:hypothetical protein
MRFFNSRAETVEARLPEGHVDVIVQVTLLLDERLEHFGLV